MKRNIVWKVLNSRMRTSAGLNHRSHFALYYPIGKLVSPDIGKVFCFKEKKYALRFMKKSRRFSLHKAIGINPKPIHTIAFDEYGIRKFWDGVPAGCSAPKGSYICDAIKCLE